jgi:acyl-CoA reductase-like NAD-dependent aldehyde dehydrogenase
MLRPGAKNVRVLANWIGGRFVQPAGLEFLENVNPFTQDIIGIVPQSTGEIQITVLFQH